MLFSLAMNVWKLNPSRNFIQETWFPNESLTSKQWKNRENKASGWFLESIPQFLIFSIYIIKIYVVESYHTAFRKNLLVRFHLITLYIEKIRFFFWQKHLFVHISQKPHFLNAILLHNFKPLSITRVYAALQKILLISIFYTKHFRCKNVFFLRGRSRVSNSVLMSVNTFQQWFGYP